MTGLDPETLLSAYAQGVFPMADRDGVVRFYTADPRGIIPLHPPEAFHVPRTLRQIVRQGRFEIRVDHDFEATMRACMEAREGGTWISDDLIEAYRACTRSASRTASRRGRRTNWSAASTASASAAAFFGESMFHRVTDASKVALVHLVDRLRNRGYELLDTQATTPHLRRFGCIDISASKYLKLLERAMERECSFV